MNHNSLIYQDSNAYQIGRKDGYDEIMSQMHDIIDKCYNTGYKDAMDFAIDWLKRNANKYTYNTGGYDEYIPKVGGKCWEDLKQDMEERLCKEISK